MATNAGEEGQEGGKQPFDWSAVDRNVQRSRQNRGNARTSRQPKRADPVDPTTGLFSDLPLELVAKILSFDRCEGM